MKEVIDTVSVALASGEVEELGGAVMQDHLAGSGKTGEAN